MKLSTRIARGSSWTLIAYGLSQFARFATNVVLTRLLAPELFGIMVIVNSVRLGMQLTTDAGVSQNIVVNPSADRPEFLNTGWTINLIRGVALGILCAAISIPVANFYDTKILTIIFPVAGLLFVFEGLTSLARPLLQRRLKFAKINSFDLLVDWIGFAAHVILAILSPTIWALVFAALIGSAARTIGSYVLIPGIRHRIQMSKGYAWEIIHFSKWILISSIAIFFSTNVDRLFLAKMVPLELLGVYGIARTLAEPLTLLSQRLSGMIVFPIIASSKDITRELLKQQISSTRFIFLLSMAVGASLFAATADIIVSYLYDERYQAAGWMAPILISGAWFAIICSVNEATLMGLGSPSYNAFANGAKMVWLLIGLPIGFAMFGILGAVVVVSTSDICRYIPIVVGQVRLRFSFVMQDIAATILFIGLIALCEWLRHVSGLQTSFSGLPGG